MKDITSIAVTGEDGVMTYANGSKKEFQCSGAVVTIIASLAATLGREHKIHIATDGRLRRMYTRDDDMVSRGLDDTSATSTAPTAMNAELMRPVCTAAPKYDSTLSDADPRIITLDVLRYAPTEAFNAVHPTPISKVQLDQAIGMFEQVGDYMKANNITPKIVSTEDAIRSIDADNATFWSKKH